MLNKLPVFKSNSRGGAGERNECPGSTTTTTKEERNKNNTK
jgi:hypothetical protein